MIRQRDGKTPRDSRTPLTGNGNRADISRRCNDRCSGIGPANKLTLSLRMCLSVFSPTRRTIYHRLPNCTSMLRVCGCRQLESIASNHSAVCSRDITFITLSLTSGQHLGQQRAASVVSWVRKMLVEFKEAGRR